MKKIIAITCFLMCLIPSLAIAKESASPFSEEGRAAEISPSGWAEWKEESGMRLTDHELCLISGQAIATNLPEARGQNNYRVVLWDEGGGNTDSATNHGSGVSITTISR